MKKAISFLMLVALPVISNADVIPAPVDHLYLPFGFDSNDTVEVVVTGSFPNACHSRNEVKVNVENDVIDVSISAITHEKSFPAKRCMDMVVPFKEVVHLGNLQGGDYKIRVNNILEEKLTVAEASSNSVDDHIYAAVEYVEKKGMDNFVLHGWRYSNCIELDQVKVVSNNKDTLSILPVMKQLSDFCPMKMMPVEYKVKLDFSTLTMKQPLLHVRTMDGKSINTVINLEER